MKRRVLLASATVVAVSWCGVAAAQVISAPTNGNIGQKRLQIDLSGRILYDSNVARGQDLVSAVRRLHKEEITYAPAAQVNAFLPVGRQVLYANLSGGYEFREYNKTLEAPRISATTGAAVQLGKCGLNINGTYGYSQSDVSDLPLQVNRNRQETLGAAAQVSCSAGVGLTGFVGAQAGATNNSASDFVIDSKVTSFVVGIGYENRVLGSLQLIGNYSKSTYDDSTSPLIQPAANFEAYSAGVRFSRPIGARLRGAASLSYQTVHSDDPLIGDSSSLAGTGELDYRLNSRIGLNLAYNRGAAASIIEGVDYVQLTSITFGARYALSSRLSSSLNASWNKTDYKGPGPLPIGIATNEKTRVLGGDVTLKVGRTASLALDAHQEKRTSDKAQFEYTSYQVGATARQSF